MKGREMSIEEFRMEWQKLKNSVDNWYAHVIIYDSDDDCIRFVADDFNIGYAGDSTKPIVHFYYYQHSIADVSLHRIKKLR